MWLNCLMHIENIQCPPLTPRNHIALTAFSPWLAESCWHIQQWWGIMWHISTNNMWWATISANVREVKSLLCSDNESSMSPPPAANYTVGNCVATVLTTVFPHSLACSRWATCTSCWLGCQVRFQLIGAVICMKTFSWGDTRRICAGSDELE